MKSEPQSEAIDTRTLESVFDKKVIEDNLPSIYMRYILE